MKILFIRHGESIENIRGKMASVVNDAPLTKEGLKQTYAFLPVLKKYGVQKVYYSPKERAKRIGEIIDKKLRIPHEAVSDLSERDWGTWGNKPWREVSKKLDKLSIKQRYEIVPPKGESWKQFEKRLLTAIKRIEAEAEEKGYNSVAIVTHKGSLRAIFPVLSKTNIREHKKFSTELGSISIVSKTDKAHYSLDMLNLVPRRGISKFFLGSFKKSKAEED